MPFFFAQRNACSTADRVRSVDRCVPVTANAPTARDIALVEIVDADSHVSAVLAEEDVRIGTGAFDAENDRGRQAIRIGLDVADIRAECRQRFAHEAAHVFVAHAREHGAAQAQTRDARTEVGRGAPEILGEALHVFEPATDLLAVKIHGGASQADQVQRSGHFDFSSSSGTPEIGISFQGPGVFLRELGNGVGIACEMANDP